LKRRGQASSCSQETNSKYRSPAGRLWAAASWPGVCSRWPAPQCRPAGSATGVAALIASAPAVEKETSRAGSIMKQTCHCWRGPAAPQGKQVRLAPSSACACQSAPLTSILLPSDSVSVWPSTASTRALWAASRPDVKALRVSRRVCIHREAARSLQCLVHLVLQHDRWLCSEEQLQPYRNTPCWATSSSHSKALQRKASS